LNSSFARWYDNDVKVLVPWGYNSHGPKQLCVLNTTQLNFFDRNDGPGSNDIDNLLYLYISGKLDTIYQIPLTLGNSLRAAIHDAQSFFMTPIAIYIMRQVLKFN
jgi:hypothetical protein